MKKNTNISVLFRYIVSYVSIFFLTCILICTLLLKYYIKDFIEYSREMEKYKVTLAEESLDSQLEAFNKIRYKIATSVIYFPFYIERNEYYEREMLEQLTLYEGTSLFSEEFFLLYLDSQELFTSGGGKKQFDLFVSYVCGMENGEEIFDQLKNINDFTILDQDKNDCLWLCFPVRFYSTIPNANAVLVSIVDKSVLIEHILKISALENNSFTVYYEDQLLIDAYEEENRMMSQQVDREGFHIEYDYATSRYLQGISVFQKVNIIILVFAFVFLLIVALLTAYYNFLPIYNVNEKIREKIQNDKRRNIIKNELSNIEETFNAVYDENENYIKQLYKQLEALKYHLLRTLVRGKWDESMNEQLKLVHIDFTGKQLAVLRIEGIASVLSEVDGVVKAIENLSDEDFKYYAQYEADKREIIVIMALDDKYLKNDAVASVKDLLKAKEMSVRISVGTVYDTPSQLVNSYLELSEFNDEPMNREDSDEFRLIYNNSFVDKIEIAVRAGNYAEARKWLKKLVEEIRGINSILLQQCMYSDMISMLMRTAGELQIYFSPQHVSGLLTSYSLNDFYQKVDSYLKELCNRTFEDMRNSENATLYLVRDFVQENFLDYNMTLESLAEKFDVSVTYLSRSFKKVAGKNYKEYIIQLKMEYAIELLEEGASVIEVSQKAGYANVSHFIRTFRKQIGVTPSAYKSCHNQMDT